MSYVDAVLLVIVKVLLVVSVFITIPVLSIKYTAVPTELIKYSPPPPDDTDSLGVKHIRVGTPL